MGLRQLPGPRQLPGHRRRHLRPREQHLRAGRLRRRRHLPRRGRLPAALGAIRRPAQPRRGLPAAARTDLPADRVRAQRRQRRAVDAARRQPQPHPHPRGLTESLRLGRLVLAGPHHLGARRRLCRLPRHRPRLRRLPPAAPGSGHRGARPGGADQLRAVPALERAARARVADHRRCRCQFGGRARPGGLRPGRRRRRRPQRARRAGRRHRRHGFRHREHLAVRGDPALGDIALGVAPLGRADAHRPGRRRHRAGPAGTAERRRGRHGRLHPAPADRDRARQPVGARAGRQLADRLRRRRPGTGPACRRDGHPLGRPAAARRHRGRLVLRPEPSRVSPPTTRPPEPPTTASTRTAR